ncbi:UPF0481 protein At3g47200 [Elaeis guineensis]
MEVWENVDLSCHKNPSDKPCTVFKVPKHIRELDPQAYDPVIASCGPFHHCPCCWNSGLQYDKDPTEYHELAYKSEVVDSLGPFQHDHTYSTTVMQHHKWRCVGHLLSRYRCKEFQNQLLRLCLSDLKKKDAMVRSCYSEGLPAWLDEQKLASIMLLDGCFIIYFMLERKENEDRKKKKGMKEKTEENDAGMLEQLEAPTVAGLFTFNLVLYDLLKLENQIPFFIIKLLFDQLKPCKDDLVDLALQLFKGIHPEESESFKNKKEKSTGEYHHLLHLFYSSRTALAGSTSKLGCIRSTIECIKSQWKKTEAAGSTQETLTSAPKWIPSATELNRSGVKFKRKKQQANNFLNITFERRKMKIMPLLCLWKLCLMFRSGRMEIPPLQIYDYTGPLFRNLIAFEQCYLHTEMYITIYALFMDCIIDQAEDVRLLHLGGILEHKLSSDRAVAELFNQLGCQILFLPEKIYLANQIERVNKFYDSRWHKWLANLRRHYLGNPWAIISVLAAIFLLVLTIEQAVFSALSYFHSS